MLFRSYSLDKFIGDIEQLTSESCYVVDGQSMGNATRFINHSCEPNLRQFTVSYNKYDLWVYELAFFAIEDIPAVDDIKQEVKDIESGFVTSDVALPSPREDEI